MNTLKTIGVTALFMLVVFAILDLANKTSYIIYPVTTIRGLISGKIDSTVATLNAPPSN
jgi:hypothetical protein